ncbi:MAG: hypothetical protein O3C57_01270, partial [Verrucomicrobia bacterium]|nr:hypothetical protein [Verrucomicrobiota bacterium]
MPDMQTALRGGYAHAYEDMIDPPTAADRRQAMAANDPAQYYQGTPFMRSLWEGRLPTWLGQAYQQDIKPLLEQAPDPLTMQGALAYGAMPAKAVVGMVKGAGDILQKAMDNPNDTRAMFDLATMVAGGGFLSSKAIGGVPRGAVLGANVSPGRPTRMADVPSLRDMPVEDAIKIARKEPHLI